jgi:hypothetical protein
MLEISMDKAIKKGKERREELTNGRMNEDKNLRFYYE